MDDDLLTTLLRGEHVGMEERLRRGAWPHPPLRLSELAERIVRILERERWFPREWQPAQEGGAFREGGVIERLGPDRFLYRTQRTHPIRPDILVGSTETTFSSGLDAALHYLRWDLRLPGGKLDGYEVIE